MPRHLLRAATVLAALLTILVLGTAPAAARTTTLTDPFDVTATAAPCGFAVQIRDVGTNMFRFHDDRVDLSQSGVRTYTNLANGLSATQDFQTLFKNSNTVFDEATGYFSLDQTTMGSGTLRGPDGRVLLRDHGPVSAHLVINPSAESEDEFLISQEIFFSHGAHPSEAAYCAALTTAIGPDAAA
jgi:hypothetical protein